ncbi:unnamed protein product, partial [Urochloa humidicola]
FSRDESSETREKRRRIWIWRRCFRSSPSAAPDRAHLLVGIRSRPASSVRPPPFLTIAARPCSTALQHWKQQEEDLFCASLFQWSTHLHTHVEAS